MRLSSSVTAIALAAAVAFGGASPVLADCLSIVPFGYNGRYVHLPPDADFCVTNADGTHRYQTDEAGARLVGSAPPDRRLDAFGESQLLALDWGGGAEPHPLRQAYPATAFRLHAAPNNGPIQSLAWIRETGAKRPLGRTLIGFNFGTDVFRIAPGWNPEAFVALESSELGSVLRHPILYDLKILRGLVTGRHFTIGRPNPKELREVYFGHRERMEQLFGAYLDALVALVRETGLKPDFVLYPPYWGYDVDGDRAVRDPQSFEAYRRLVCSPALAERFPDAAVHVMDMPATAAAPAFFTKDGRHFRSGALALVERVRLCAG